MSVASQPLPAFQRYQAEFTSHIRNPVAVPRPAGVKARGMAVYKEIVFNNMMSTLTACFPVAKRTLGVRLWTKVVRTFFAQHACRTPLFRQIPEEFLRWLESDPMENLPMYLYSLAHYEWVELAIALSEADIAADRYVAEGDLLSGRPVLAPALKVLQYPFPVQQISPKFKPTEPDEQPTYILTFRNLDDEVRFIVLNPVSARLVNLLAETQLTGAGALQVIANELQHPKPEVVQQGGLEILENLRAEQAIWGVFK